MLLYILGAALLVVVVLVVIAAIPAPISRTNEEVADYIEGCVHGGRDPWDWDDFTSIKIKQPDLDAIRLKCCAIQDEHPPDRDGELCSQTGITALLDLARQVRAAA